MRYAKIDSSSKVVTDLIAADKAPTAAPGFMFVKYDDKQQAWIGLRWSDKKGFEQPVRETPMADDFIPGMAAPTITAQEFETQLRKYERDHPRG